MWFENYLEESSVDRKKLIPIYVWIRRMKIQLEGKSFGKKILFSDKNSFCKKKNSILKKKDLLSI